jgi:hypothetical protein
MANINLKKLFEAEDFKARSKETGKLVHFKSKDAYQAAIKAGSHEDPKADKGKTSKTSTKPNDMFGGDYAKDRGGETPTSNTTHVSVQPDSQEVKTISKFTSTREKFIADFINKHKLDASALSKFIEKGSLRDRMDVGTAMVGNPGNKYEKDLIKKFGTNNSTEKADNIEALTSYKDFNKFFKANSHKLNKNDLAYIEDEIGALKYLESDYKRGNVDREEVETAYIDLQDLIKKALPKADAPKADVKSIIKGLLKTADKEFGGAHKLKDVVDNFKDSIDDSDDDGAELKARLDKGENGVYVQTDETEGTIVFNDGSQYQFSHVEDGPIPVTKVGKEEPETSSKLTSMLPKKASQLDSKHSKMVQDVVNAETGLKGYVDTDDNTGTFMYNVGMGDMPTYTLYFGSNDDYGKPDEFRVTLEPTYGNDPSGLEGKIDKSFKSADEAMKFMIAVAKKYKKELEMDDEDTNESTKLTTMIKK